MEHDQAQRIASVLNQAAREMDEVHPRLSRSTVGDVRELDADLHANAIAIAGRLNALKAALNDVQPMSYARALKIIAGSQPIVDRATGRRTDIGSGAPSTVLVQHMLDWAEKAGDKACR